MSDAVANCTLELACTVGSIADAIEALEDGADINHGGGAPLFNAIFNRNVEIIRFLIDREADLSAFITPARRATIGSVDQLIEVLMECAPPDPKAIDPGIMGEMDATIRKSGLGKPVLEGDWDGVVYFVEKLARIGAPELSEVVAEFVQLLEPAKSWGDAALFEAVKGEKKKIAKLTERYLAIECAGVEAMARAFLDNENGDPGDGAQNQASEDAADGESRVDDGTKSEGDSGNLTAIAV